MMDKLPATPKEGQPPSVAGDPRNQAFVILVLAFVTQWLGKKLSPELMGPVSTVLVVVVGMVAAPLYMIYGIMMSKLRVRYQKATQEALIEAAQDTTVIQVQGKIVKLPPKRK